MSDEHEEHAERVAPPPIEVAAGPPRLLANRPFVWLVVGEGFAGLGLWSYFLAVIGDATYRLDATAGEIGILLGCFSITFIPSTPLWGGVADRWSPQRMMLIATASFVGTLVIASFASSLPLLYLSMLWVGAAQGVLWPARGALVPRLVEPGELIRANGMISLVRELPMALGPALAGLAVTVWGRHAPYWVGIGGLAVAFCFYLVVPDRRVSGKLHEDFLRDLAAGLRASMGVPILRLLFLTAFGAMAVLGLMQTLEPIFVRRVLGRGQDALGVLWSVQGVGALIASFVLIRLRRAVGAEMTVIAIGVALSGIGLVVYAAPGVYPATLAGAAVFGFGFPLFFSTGQALIQRISRAPGKVSSVYIVAGEIGPLVAALGIGALGRVDVRVWLVGAAAGLLALGMMGLWAAHRPRLLAEEARARP